jgi:hypothetical protein
MQAKPTGGGFDAAQNLSRMLAFSMRRGDNLRFDAQQ